MSQNRSRYIEMCEAGYELRNYWEPQRGDRVYLKRDLYMGNGQLTAIQNGVDEPMYNEGVYHITEDFSQSLLDPQTFYSYCIFLPYQHQLQERVLKNLNSTQTSLWDFFAFCNAKKTGKPIYYYNFDELWLMFYYSIVHKKRWNGSEWIDEGETDV